LGYPPYLRTGSRYRPRSNAIFHSSLGSLMFGTKCSPGGATSRGSRKSATPTKSVFPNFLTHRCSEYLQILESIARGSARARRCRNFQIRRKIAFGSPCSRNRKQKYGGNHANEFADRLPIRLCIH